MRICLICDAAAAAANAIAHCRLHSKRGAHNLMNDFVLATSIPNGYSTAASFSYACVIEIINKYRSILAQQQRISIKSTVSMMEFELLCQHV